MSNLFGQSEKQMSALQDLSVMAWNYYQQLKEQGFNDEQALQLVLNWQTAIMGGTIK